MNAADNPQIDVLWNASARDERTLRHPLDDEIFGFHAQQAIEKLYKVLITAHGEESAFNHDLAKLALHLSALGEDLPPLPLSYVTLNAYAIDARYDAASPLPVDLREALRTAIATLRSFVAQRRGTLRSTGVQVRNP